MDFSYLSTFSSSTLNVTSWPPAVYFSTSTSAVQVFPSPSRVTSYFFPSDPVTVNLTVSGLTPSWSSASSQIFVTFIVFFSGTCVFVISTSNPLSASPVTSPTVLVYPSGTFGSATVYLIALPFLLTASFSHVYDHWFASFSVTGSPDAAPSACSWTLILAGLIPSWLFASSHTFVTVNSVVSGVCLFVMVPWSFAGLPVVS